MASQLGAEEVFRLRREDFDRELRDTKSSPSLLGELCAGMKEDIHTLHHRYIHSRAPLSELRDHFYTVWYMFIQISQAVDAQSAEQDRLVNILSYAKNLGTCVNTAAVNLDGRMVWSSLPNLVVNLRRSWEVDSANLSSAQRRNFAAFTARLLVLGVCDESVSFCALSLLREALETPQSAEPVGSKTAPSAAQLLPAVAEWMSVSSPKLLRLSIQSYGRTDTSGPSINPGELAQAAGIRDPGFSVARWVFWRRRLGELWRDGGADVARNARAAFADVIRTGKLLGYEIPGERSYSSRVEKVLFEELKRSGQPSVSEEDVTVDPDWANEPALKNQD